MDGIFRPAQGALHHGGRVLMRINNNPLSTSGESSSKGQQNIDIDVDEFNELATDPVTGEITPKSKDEAVSALQARSEGRASDNIRRPDADLGENIHLDFIDDGVYVEVKRAHDPLLHDPLNLQVSNVADDIIHTPDTRFIIDLGHLNTTGDKFSYLYQLAKELMSSGIDIFDKTKFIILNP